MSKQTGEVEVLTDLARAAAWTANYQSQEIINSPGEVSVKGHTYSRSSIEMLLGQVGCEGIRIYYALDELGAKRLVIVAVDADGNDMEEVVVDDSKVCPPNCSTTGVLNG